MVALNVNGLLYVAHAALPHLIRAAEEGRRRVADLVNVSSMAGRRATAAPASTTRPSSRVNAFSESLRQEVTERHVRVSLVEPGAVETELTDHLRPEIREQLRSSLRLRAPARGRHRRRDRLHRHPRPRTSRSTRS